MTAYYRGLIAVDSEGRIWIQAFRLNSDGTHTAVVTVSTNGGGSFAQQPSLATLGDRGGGRLISLGTRLMFLYGGHGCCETGKMRLRSDSDPLATWSSAATVLSDGIYHGAALSALGDGAGGMHLVYKDKATMALHYFTRALAAGSATNQNFSRSVPIEADLLLPKAQAEQIAYLAETLAADRILVEDHASTRALAKSASCSCCGEGSTNRKLNASGFAPAIASSGRRACRARERSS